MKKKFIQMVATAGHAVAFMINLIFKHIIDYVQLYFTNGRILFFKASIVSGLLA